MKTENENANQTHPKKWWEHVALGFFDFFDGDVGMLL